MIRRSAHS